MNFIFFIFLTFCIVKGDMMSLENQLRKIKLDSSNPRWSFIVRKQPGSELMARLKKRRVKR